MCLEKISARRQSLTLLYDHRSVFLHLLRRHTSYAQFVWEIQSINVKPVEHGSVAPIALHRQQQTDRFIPANYVNRAPGVACQLANR